MAFGSCIDIAGAVTIGLLPELQSDRFMQVGNSAGMGARLALIFRAKREEAKKVVSQIAYIGLAAFPALTSCSPNRRFLAIIQFGRVTKMETRISNAAKEVFIGNNRPTVLIGERLNPTGKKKLSQALMERNFDLVRNEALAQVSSGADILDVNVGVTGVDEVELLSQVVQLVAETVNVPLCIDSNNIRAIEAALATYKGKALVNSVSGKEGSLKDVLPVVKEYGAAVIALPMDELGIPNEAGQRVAVARRIVETAERMGIPRQDIIVDCLATAVGADNQAGLLTLQTIQRVKAELGLNTTLGSSNISFGLPDRELLGSTFLAMAISEGLDCAIVNVSQALPVVLAANLVMARDDYAMAYIRFYRESRNLQ